MNELLYEFIKEVILLEKKKKKKKPKKNPDYFKGTKKSNKSMSKEIEKCKGPDRPKSCYKYWSADKEYDEFKGKSKKKGKKKK